MIFMYIDLLPVGFCDFSKRIIKKKKVMTSFVPTFC